MKTKIAFHTVGCKLNFSETSSLANNFSEEVYEFVDFNTPADIYVLNTCAVTKNAEKKCRQLISKAKNINPEGKIAVIGCYSQLKPEDFKNIEGVSIILGTEEKFKLSEHIDKLKGKDFEFVDDNFETNIEHKFYHSYSATDRTRTFLKIQDGCDYFCSYCTIPIARGRSRNAPISELIEKAKEITKKGVKEIILTGINIGDFGKTTNENLYSLLVELEKISELKRIRISSIEPNLITDDLINLISKSYKIMPHLHIPLQAGTNRVLGLMRRRYLIDDYVGRISSVKSKIKNVSIGTDVILGFPGESIEEFNETKNFLSNLDIDFIHAFPYSERENTKSFLFDGKVDQSERYRRCNEIIELSDQKKYKFAKSFLNKELSVLFEANNKKGKIMGYTENYLRTEFKFSKELINEIAKVKVVEIKNNSNLVVELIKIIE